MDHIPDREEVVEGLKKVWDAFEAMEHELYADYVFEALELLKAPEPRLLTVDEINAMPDHTVLWQEGRIDWSACKFNPLNEIGVEYEIAPVEKLGTVISESSGTTVIDADLLTAKDGVQLRFWSAWPTDEQRKAAKWDG